jgi:two-component system nitrogen regulation sensor histidine kinase GlnL
MARMLAHEIRNPLAGMRGAAQLLAKSAAGDEDRELAGLIVREASRIEDLVGRVAQLGAEVTQDETPVNLHAVADHVVQLCAAAFPALRIAKDYDPSLPEVAGNAGALTQVILNLVKNAAEAGAASVILRTFYDTDAAYHPDSGLKMPLTLAVEDDGAGIAPDVAARLFEPYFSTKPQGEGLGLSIVSQLVDAHGGLVTVQSGAEGTAFKVSFPLARAAGAKTRKGGA